MTPGKRTLTVSVEDYLKAVYSLTRDGTPASTSGIAKALGVQPASVTGMVKRLAEEGFFEHHPYKGVRLTETGMREALRIVRRHRILETYLQLRLDYPWEEVHAEAERLEHAASEALIERMADALQDPTHDPHGAPIPTRTGEVEAPTIATLAGATDDTPVRVHSVQDEDPERLKYLETLGLVPGARVVILERAPFKGLITVQVGEAPPEVIGDELARRVYIAPLDGPEST